MAYETLPTLSAPTGASVTSSIINIINTIIGAGILAMPFAYKSDGILLGTIVILAAGLTAAFGLYLQGLSSLYVARGHASFFSLAKVTYPSLAVLFDLAITIKCFGVGVSYLIIIADLMPQIMQSLSVTAPLLQERTFWVSISMIIVGPLSFLRKLDSLKYTSVVALVSVGYLVLVVVGHYIAGDTLDQRGPIKVIEPANFSSILQSLPIIIFAFTCHQNMFSVINELDAPSVGKFFSIISTSIGSSAFFYLLVGLCGYLAFGDNVGGNIISMYHYSWTSTIGRIAIVILVVFSYPLQCHPCRASLNHVIHWFSEVSHGSESAHERDPLVAAEAGPAETSDEVEQDAHGSPVTVPLHATRFNILTSLILAASFWLAITVNSLELMLAFVGSTGSTSISFILPGIFGYSLLGNKTHRARDPIAHEGILKAASLALVVWGVLVVIVCLSTNIWVLTKK